MNYLTTCFFCIILTSCTISSGLFAAKKSSLNVLFIGNSYTARHHLANVVKEMAEAGNPELTFNPTSVIYGGRTLKDHWNFGTQHVVNQYKATRSEIEATVTVLKQTVKETNNRYAKLALTRQQTLLKEFELHRGKWDLIVLQSYRDDLNGDDSLYMQYAPKYAELAKAQGARVILYVTTPDTQNTHALASAPDKAPILEKTKSMARLANRIEANAAPMALVVHRCQTQRPDLPLQLVSDAHLNKTLAYLTACTLYAAIFDKSPQGLPMDTITDTRIFENDPTKDRDGQPITRVFSDKDRNDLQRIAWEGYQEFQKLRSQP